VVIGRNVPKSYLTTDILSTAFFPQSVQTLEGDLMKIGLTLRDFDQREALVFWLGGVAIKGDSGKRELHGFSKDPRRPLTGSETSGPYFDFDPDRLIDRDLDGWLE
jgi:hypothetical protein